MNPLFPKTAALLADNPAAARDVLAGIAEKGVVDTRKLLGKLARAADFEGSTTLYADCATLPEMVKKHGSRLYGLQCVGQAQVALSEEIRRVADRLGLTLPEIEELAALAAANVALAEALRAAWETERKRHLRAEELASFQAGTALRHLFADLLRAEDGADEEAVAA